MHILKLSLALMRTTDSLTISYLYFVHYGILGVEYWHLLYDMKLLDMVWHVMN